jgi:hypothetical protein
MIKRLAGRFLRPSTENITEHFPGFLGFVRVAESVGCIFCPNIFREI